MKKKKQITFIITATSLTIVIFNNIMQLIEKLNENNIKVWLSLILTLVVVIIYLIINK